MGDSSWIVMVPNHVCIVIAVHNYVGHLNLYINDGREIVG